MALGHQCSQSLSILVRSQNRPTVVLPLPVTTAIAKIRLFPSSPLSNIAPVLTKIKTKTPLVELLKIAHKVRYREGEKSDSGHKRNQMNSVLSV